MTTAELVRQLRPEAHTQQWHGTWQRGETTGGLRLAFRFRWIGPTRVDASNAYDSELEETLAVSRRDRLPDERDLFEVFEAIGGDISPLEVRRDEGQNLILLRLGPARCAACGAAMDAEAKATEAATCTVCAGGGHRCMWCGAEVESDTELNYARQCPRCAARLAKKYALFQKHHAPEEADEATEP